VYAATLNHKDQFFARANFQDAPPLDWGPIPGQCGGSGYIVIVP
jgi:hypothetical protein